MLNSFKFIMTLIGTFIGAGFASGKELYVFFLQYGICGLIGIFTSCIILKKSLEQILKFCKKNNIKNYNEFIKKIFKNKITKKIFSNVMNFVYLTSFFMMTSGFSTFLYQEFNINKTIGTIIFLVFCYSILVNKINGLIKINNICIPLIIILIFFIGYDDLNFEIIKNINSNNNNFIFSQVSAILYAGSNIITLIPLLIKSNFVNEQDQKRASFLFTFFIGCISIILFCLMINSNVELGKIEMPAIFAVGEKGNLYKKMYQFIIFVSVITTALSSAYGFLQKYENDKKKYNKVLKIILGFSFFIFPIKFSNFIEFLYPLFGTIGIIIVIKLAFKEKDKKKI